MFTLKNIKKMAEEHHFFFNNIPMIHVGGTNGKGSVCAMLSHILSKEYTVGLYTSPYDQVRFDNIYVQDKPVDPHVISEVLKAYEADFQQFGLSEFEIDTWVALAIFHQKNVDYAVIEVGLGGEDDATNIITPILSIITNIGMDHQDVLGKTRMQIAAKKAGIIKPGVPIVIGPNMHKDARKVIKDVAIHHQSPFNQARFLKEDFFETIHYQKENIATVISALNILKHPVSNHAIMLGLRDPIMPKRFQIVSEKPWVVLDAAHNLEGTLALIQTLKTCQKTDDLVIIFSILKDKPYEKMIEAYQTISDALWFIPFEHPRALKPNSLDGKKIQQLDSIQEAIQCMLSHPEKNYVMTGSLYFLRHIYPHIKGVFNHGKE